MNGSILETNAGCLLVVDDQESNIQIVGAARPARIDPGQNVTQNSSR